MKINKRKKTVYERFFKRFFDVVLSLVALLFLSPVFLVIAIISRISIGKGGVFFGQYRPGKNGKLFKLYKFRSMTNDTDENGELLPDKKRITKFGKFLRKTSLDELPQLFNILKGDLSIVGPRPRLVKDMIFYTKEVLKAYEVKPGLTGPSQVSGGRSESNWDKIFEEDLKYSQKITFFGDLKIILKTVVILFKHSDGANEGSQSSKREYYYCDHLYKTNQITKEQYNLGLKISNNLIANGGNVEYVEELHQHLQK